MKKFIISILFPIHFIFGLTCIAQSYDELDRELEMFFRLREESRFEDALSCLNRMDSICTSASGVEKIYLIALHNNYGQLKEDLGDYISAGKHYRTALEYSREDMGSKAILLQNLASLSLQTGEYQDAKNYAEQSLEISETALDSLYSLRWSALASAHQGIHKTALKRLAEAGEICGREGNRLESAIQLTKEAEVLETIGDYTGAERKYDSAVQAFSQLFGPSHHHTVSALYGKAKASLLSGQAESATEYYKEYYAKKLEFFDDEVVNLDSYALNRFMTGKNEGFYDAPLFCEMAGCKEGPMTEISLNISLLCKSVFIKERDMEYSRRSWRDVARQMGSETAGVDFVKYRNGKNEERYCAFVYSAGHEYPEMVSLCSEKEIIAIIGDTFFMNGSEARNAFSAEKLSGLYRLLWAPLQEALNGYESIHFSPAGILNNLPLEYLTDYEGISLINKFKNIHRCILPTVISWDEDSKAYTRAAVFGQINYFETEDVRATGSYFAPLPYAVKDLGNIRSQLKPAMPLDIFSGKNASEEKFRSLRFMPEEKVILHFSTHGFYLPDSLTNFSSYYKNFKPEDILSFPMLRCGLAMSGANKVWSGGEKIKETSNDGILTAQEISEMDLNNCGLVVLAACQTGLGDINKDGTWGLPRAFKIAGAGKLLVSLWPTSDRSATEMIKLFYRNLTAGKSPNEALKAAADELKGIPEFSHPYHWAAFVVID